MIVPEAALLPPVGEDAGELLTDDSAKRREFDWDMDAYQEAEKRILEAMNFCVFVPAVGARATQNS